MQFLFTIQNSIKNNFIFIDILDYRFWRLQNKSTNAPRLTHTLPIRLPLLIIGAVALIPTV